jgi:hypothetical protein
MHCEYFYLMILHILIQHQLVIVARLYLSQYNSSDLIMIHGTHMLNSLS